MRMEAAASRGARIAVLGGVLAALAGALALMAPAPADAHNRVVKRTGQSVNQVYQIGDRNHTGCVYRYQFGTFGVPYAKAKRMPRSRPRCLGVRQGTYLCLIVERQGAVRGTCELRGVGNGWWQAQAPSGWNLVGIEMFARARGSDHRLSLSATWLP